MIAGLWAQWGAEFRAKMEEANQLSNDRGTSEVTKLVPVSTVDVAAHIANSGTDTAAKLINLKVGK